MSARARSGEMNIRAADSAQPDSTEIRFLKDMAAQGYDEACLTLARRYMDGRGAPQSDFLAFRYLRQMERQNNPVVHRFMAEILTRDRGVPPNPALAYKYQRSAFQHYRILLQRYPMPVTLTRLGTIYEHGLGVECDLGIASRYYLESAQRGEIEGAWKLAEFWAKGKLAGPGPDKGTAWQGQIHFIFSEAEEGDLTLQYKLGQLFSMNRIVPPDHVQSAYWFGKAADGKLIDAYLPMGKHYEFGLGVEPDENKALELYREAAKSVGDEEARYRAAALILNRGPLEDDWEEVSEILFGFAWERYSLGRLFSAWVAEEL